MRKYLLAGAAAMAITGGAQAGELTAGSGSVIGTAAPGKSVVRFDGLVVAMFGVASNTHDKAIVGGGVNGVGGTRVKNNAYGMIMYARMFPAFDAQTAGGLRYGAFAEVRANNNTGGLTGNPSGGAVGTAGQRGTNTLFWNRAYGYIGGDSWGTFRFGMVDGPASSMQVGTFQNFADGGFNGSVPGLTPGLGAFQLPINGGYEYSAQKIVYLSPSFAGFDVGFSFAPSSATHAGSDGGSINTGGSARQATSVAGSDANRYTNLIEATARYRGTFGGVGLAANVSYMGSGKVNVPGTPRRGISLVDGGAQVSYAGFTVGGHISSGTFNGNLNLSAPGEKAALVWLAGASYEAGPWTVGFHYINASWPGAFGPTTGTRNEAGFSAGATLAWAPGVRTFVEFATSTRKERGVNLNIGSGPAKNSINGTAILIGQAFRW